MSAAVQKLPKPQLRGLFRTLLKQQITAAVILGFAGSVAWKYLVMEPRKKAYAEFYKTYDADKEYARMLKAGVVPDWPKFD